MILTKEHLIIFGSVALIGATVVALLASNYAESTNTFKIDVAVNAYIADNLLVALQYTIFNTGTTEVKTVSVGAKCCDLSESYDDPLAPGRHVTDTAFLGVVSTADTLASGDTILVEFTAEDNFGNTVAFVKSVRLR